MIVRRKPNKEISHSSFLFSKVQFSENLAQATHYSKSLLFSQMLIQDSIGQGLVFVWWITMRKAERKGYSKGKKIKLFQANKKTGQDKICKALHYNFFQQACPWPLGKNVIFVEIKWIFINIKTQASQRWFLCFQSNTRKIWKRRIFSLKKWIRAW